MFIREVRFSQESKYFGKKRLAEAATQLAKHVQELCKNLNLKSGLLRVGTVGDGGEDDLRLALEWSGVQSERLSFSLKYISVEGDHPGDSGENITRVFCPECGSSEVVGETRVVGYFSKVQNWNKSKRYGELLARHAGRYNIVEADETEQKLVTATEEA